MIMWINIDKLTEWKAVKEFSVGGLEWIGFSKEYSNKLLCISSQKCTLVDCTTGNYEECDCEYDELTYTAICSLLPNEIIKISGQYGEDILQSTKKNELIKAKILPDNQTEVHYVNALGNDILIFKDYGFYTCGFSYDGKYLVFAQDAGITLLTRV